MNIPIEIVRAGKSEEYVKAHDDNQSAHRSLKFAKDVHENLLVELRDALNHNVSFFTNKTAAFLGKDQWKHALVIEELSRQLTESAGYVAEARALHEQAGEEFSKFIKEAVI
ncbi:hypothetical protein NGI46_08165 [Peribacillus butanolivorans]|uniref:hypothetical protein n=1 Tax=Peribacillus butanolivorans TaxID=421767 RepID=UPI00207CC9D7|nr:hypothetical protein [Peribacillus butanolivorans]MCO0597442.1 hypothetical protein [Peribacillus butanolivorans]